MASGYYQLPGYRVPDNAMLNMKPLNDAITGYKQAQSDNVMAQYQADRDQVSDQRQNAMLSLQQQAGARQQKQFDDKRGQEALNELAGIYQTIEASPETDRAGLYARVQPLYSKLRTRIPDFDADLEAMGIDPNDHVAVGKLVMGRARGYIDPTKNQAPSNVREWDYFSKLSPAEQEKYLTMKRAEKYLDTGTGYARPNPVRPGESTPVAPKDLQGAERAKAVGEAEGKAGADIPRVEANAERALQTIEAIRNHPGKKYGLGLAAPSGYLPGTEARGFKNLVDQAAGQTFLEAFNSLRGGGQITEAEGQKATQALARLDRYQSPEDFEAALKDLEDVVRRGLEVAKRKAGPVQSGVSAPEQDGWRDLGNGVRMRVKP